MFFPKEVDGDRIACPAGVRTIADDPKAHEKGRKNEPAQTLVSILGKEETPGGPEEEEEGSRHVALFQGQLKDRLGLVLSEQFDGRNPSYTLCRFEQPKRRACRR